AVTSVTFSPDSQTLAAGAVSDCAANIVIAAWDAGTGELRDAPSGVPADVYAVAYSPDGRVLASGGVDGVVYLAGLDGRPRLELTGHTAAITTLAFSPDQKWVASGGADQAAMVWDAATGDLRYTLFGHTDSVASVAWSPASDRLASASVDGDVRLWQVATGNLLKATALFRKLDARPLGCN